MYAVIKVGGKQQKVKTGDVIEVEHVRGDHGDSITFTPLLVVDDDGKAHVGKDLGRAVVKARLVQEQKGDKIKVFKYRPKTGYAKRQGHRQLYTLIEIEDVSLGGRRAGSRKAPPKEEPKPAEVGAPGAGAEPEQSPAEADRPEPQGEVEGADRA